MSKLTHIDDQGRARGVGRLALAEVTEPPMDLRLRAGLDPERHVVERDDERPCLGGLAKPIGDSAVPDEWFLGRRRRLAVPPERSRWRLRDEAFAAIDKLGSTYRADTSLTAAAIDQAVKTLKDLYTRPISRI